MRAMIARLFFLLLIIMAPLTSMSQPVGIQQAALVKSIHSTLFLIVKVIESSFATFYHIYELQEKLGAYWGYHKGELDYVNINEGSGIVKVTLYQAISNTPSEYFFIRWVAPSECTFRDDF